MKKILFVIGLAVAIFANDATVDSTLTIPERVDENGMRHKEKTVSYRKALIEMKNYAEKEKHARDQCIIDGKVSYFDISSEEKKETEYNKGHIFLGYGDFYSISGVKMKSGSKAYFWRDKNIPKNQIWKYNKQIVAKSLLGQARMMFPIFSESLLIWMNIYKLNNYDNITKKHIEKISQLEEFKLIYRYTEKKWCHVNEKSQHCLDRQKKLSNSY